MDGGCLSRLNRASVFPLVSRLLRNTSYGFRNHIMITSNEGGILSGEIVPSPGHGKLLLFLSSTLAPITKGIDK